MVLANRVVLSVNRCGNISPQHQTAARTCGKHPDVLRGERVLSSQIILLGLLLVSVVRWGGNWELRLYVGVMDLGIIVKGGK